MDDEVALRAARDPLVERFEISGLYGYRTISLESRFAATVLIASNGAGKTTLLGALDAFLKRQFGRLAELEFEEVRCKLKGVPEVLTLRRADALEFIDIQPDSQIARISRRMEIAPRSVIQFLTEIYPLIKNNFRTLSDNNVYSAIQRVNGYRQEDNDKLISGLISSLYDKNAYIKHLSERINAAMADIEVIYLPTYRRIELPLAEDDDDVPPWRRRKLTPFKDEVANLINAEIQFGLGDILERLRELNQSILIDSNFGYRKISANIINELIDGAFEQGLSTDQKIPSKDELSLFFSRIKEGSNTVGPFIDDLSVPNIDKIYKGGEIPEGSNKILMYFLGKLDEVINATRGVEEKVQDFVVRCNKYLSSKSTEALQNDTWYSGDIGRIPSQDDKILRINRQNLKVHAESVFGGAKIPLDALSSGEKQMVSLFAKMFLYDNERLVLIDEPELSLSIDWQRNILVDVLRAPLCRQVIAITHSPFVFDNPLEPFARGLQINVDQDALKRRGEGSGTGLGGGLF